MLPWKAVINFALCNIVYTLPRGNVDNVTEKVLSCCEEGWKRYDQHCFKLEEEHLDWNNASEKCISLGGHLASIHSKEQNDFFQEFTKEAEKSYWWIGLYNVERGKFLWKDGTDVDYTNWKPREPESYYHYRTPYCVAQSFNVQYFGDWYTLACKRQLPYLCQKNMSICVIPNEKKTDNPVYNLPTTVVPKVPRKSLSPCEDGWKFYEHHCYKLEERKLNWTEASDKCKGIGGYLPSIHSIEQNDFFEEITKETGKMIWWTGLHHHGTNRIFMWDDGTNVDYTNWRPSEPSGSYYNSGGNCVAQSFVHGYSEHGMWYVMACSTKLYSICQRKSIDQELNQNFLDQTKLIRDIQVARSSNSRTEMNDRTGFISVTAFAITVTLVIVFMASLGALLYYKRPWIEEKRSKVARVHFRSIARAEEASTKSIIEPEETR